MGGRDLDARWKDWLKENIARGCDPRELRLTLLSHAFSEASVAVAMSAYFPAGSAAVGNRQLDASWKTWLSENIARQCDPHELLGILLKEGFALDAISAAMGGHFPASSPLLGARATAPVDHGALSRVPLSGIGAEAKLWRSPDPACQLYTLNDFLTAAECEGLIALIRRRLRPSTITTEKPADPYFRTSSTCDLSEIPDELVDAVDTRIARALGIRPSYGEGIQGQHYSPGQEFKAHTDFFEPGTPEFTKFGGARGNRTWTFMVYLNEGMRGGATAFPKLGLQFNPVRGQAVIWNNLHADGTPNDRTVHAGLPPTEGEKIVITKWFREHGAGPMFYAA